MRPLKAPSPRSLAPSRVILRIVPLIITMCLPAAVVVAQPNYSWNGTSGSFADPNQWFFGATTPAGPPAAGDRALFLSGSTYTVSGNGSPAQVVVQGGEATFTGVISPQGGVTGFPSLITGLDVGLTGFGKATFMGSGAQMNSAVPVTIGGSSGGDGTLIFIDGATGSAVGTSTSASVNIAAVPASVGSLNVSGIDSEFTATGTFNVGGRGIGSITVSDNGTLNTNGILALGQAGLNIGGAIPGATGAQGVLTIATGGTVTNELQTNIGLYGQGTVNISDGTFTSTDGETNNPAISMARFAGSEGHLNVSGTGHVITEGELIVGGGGEATMTITEEGLVETFARVGVPAIVGFGSNSDGFATIDGIDAQWTVTDALVVGQLGTGEINIVSGGTLFVEYTDFEHEPYLNIGDDAGSTGTVSVSNEFSFLDASMITTKIGADAGSEGRLEITDQGSAFLQRTTFGSGGSGEVVVNTGGSLITGTAVLGELVNSTGTVTLGSNASWEVLGQLYVGSEGTGEFYVGDTTTVTVGEFISLGEAPNSYGLMTIDGPSATVNGDFNAVYIGFQGQGEVFLTNQASWTANADVTMAEITDSFGGAYIDATSEWNVTGGLYVGGSATLSGGLGYVEVAGSVTAGSVIVWNDSTAVLSDGGEIAAPQVDIHGTLAGTGTIDVTTTINDGWVTPNQGDVSTGLLTFTGDYVQTTGGVLQLDIGGTIPETEFDMIEIGGDATLDGLLMVSFIDGFIPAAEDEFEIIDLAGSIGGSLFGLGEGTFVTTVGDVDILISFQGGDGNDVVLYTETSLVEDADFDGDGDVDGRDFLIWQRGFGLTDQEDNTLGDADFDGIIDGDDLVVWQNQYGTAGLAAASVAVPEPATYVMCLLVVLAAGRRRL